VLLCILTLFLVKFFFAHACPFFLCCVVQFVLHRLQYVLIASVFTNCLCISFIYSNLANDCNFVHLLFPPIDGIPSCIVFTPLRAMHFRLFL
jgi:hypothetical protein